MEYTDIRYSDIPTCIDSVSARAAQLEDGWSPNELCGGEQSHAYIIKHPIETQLTPCDGIHWHQVQWHYYVYWFCECQSSTTGGRMVSKWLCEGEQSHAYIIKHPIETQLTPCDGIHWHQYSDIPTCIDSVSARAAQLEDGWSPNELCEGEQSHAYIIKHPIETQLTPCVEYTDISTVTFLHVLILWVPEQHNWRTDGLQMNCVGESSLMLT